MTNRKVLAAAVLAAAVAGIPASGARADDSAFTLGQPVYARQMEPESEGLLQSEMRSRGMGGDMLEQYGIKVNGYVDMGWTFNFNRTPGGFNGVGILFNEKSDDPNFNQLSISVAREVLPSADQFDTGFMFQVLYGADARYTQANGTNFYGDGFNNRQVGLPNNPKLLVITPGQQYPENQIDIFQAYLQFNLPVCNGVKVTAGKFEVPWGVERVEPNQNGLYSHSYMFGLSQPMTLTGLSADWRYNDDWAFKGGVVVGWDQSLEDNNDMASVFIQARYKLDEEWSFVLTYMTGPEKPENRSDWRQLVDLTAQYKMGADWTLNFEGLMGYEDDVGTNLTGDGQRVFLFTDAAWYGAAIYSTYRLDVDGMYTLQARGEYFNDEEGARQLITEVYSATMGLNYCPFVHDRIGRNLMIRPELRYDYASDNVFDGDTRKSQVTASIDAIFSF